MTGPVLDGDLAVTVDEAVEFDFTVTNVGEAVVELTFSSGLGADFVVSRDDERMWRWSEGRMYTQALWTETLQPGEAISFGATWGEPQPGQYEALATLLAENADVQAGATFEV
jgi:hypothetical protein